MKISGFSLFLFAFINLYAYNQINIHINKGEIGVIYNTKTEEFASKSILKPGKYELKKNDTVLIFNCKPIKTIGEFPTILIDGTEIKIEFSFVYQLKQSNIKEFAKIFYASPYERQFLVPKVEKLIYEYIKNFNKNDIVKESKQIISQKVKENINNNFEINRFFKILEMSITQINI